MVVPVNSGRRCGKRPLSHLVYALVSRMIGFVGTESERVERKTTSLFSSLNKGGRQPTGLGSGEGSLPIRVLSSPSLYDGEEEKFSPQLKAAFIVFLLKTFTAIKHRFHRSGGPKNSPKNAH